MADPSFYMRYPGFRNKAVTLSYDDGITPDIRLADILDRYAMKCTFNINAGYLGHPLTKCEGRRLIAEEIAALSERGHEIAAHGYKHKWLSALPAPQIFYEMLRDRKELEAIVKRPVTGLAYAMGDYDARVIELLRKAGFAYARTTRSTHSFRTPIDFLEWHPTCHHADAKLMPLAKSFVENTKDNDRPLLFYLWGHSYEFEMEQNWDIIENFCDFIGKREELWYVTNGELAAYTAAYRSLVFDAERTRVYNPSSLDICFSLRGKDFLAPAGKTTNL